MARVKEREVKAPEITEEGSVTPTQPVEDQEKNEQQTEHPVVREEKAPPATVESESGVAPKAAVDKLPMASSGVSPLDLPSDVFEAGLARRKRNRVAIMEWIRTALVEGTDYGRIHTAGKERCWYGRRGEASLCPMPSHWSKPNLFKPGAEKICGMLGVTVHFPNLNAYEQAALSGHHLTAIILRCELRDSLGRTVAEGIGARSLQQDYGDLNKSLKMAGKSAHIDATLRMAGLSEVFTQDLEDMHFGSDLKTQTVAEKGEKPAAESAEERMNTERQASIFEAYGSGPRRGSISGTQVNCLEDRIKGLGLDRDRVLRWVKAASKDKINSFEEMTTEIYERVVSKLEEWAKPSRI